MADLFSKLTPIVNKCMSNHDPSHNPAHVHRVVALARTILSAETSSTATTTTNKPRRSYDPTVVDLAALLHDIADRKYLYEIASTIATLSNPSSSSNALAFPDEISPTNLVQQMLVAHGADAALAHRVQTIVSHVSYTVERSDASKVRQLIDGEFPELAIVQDADRLDAIGAIGIGRCFTFLGARGRDFVPEGSQWDMQNAVEHFEEKLEKLEGMMKTDTGRAMARERTARLLEFRRWWEEEMHVGELV
ncbi:hypothetical protein FE257_001765 [Aspergillus nanangensis]|uniref:HD/PDEase domain-containing protein n=1 Tax=Aspergillus nanangensis TaxID=2582783 RepID=A0AAD4CDF1_ASPNN|nr:hypothetical protein FE257_001765 [Aspergillus nanangensis]